MWLLHGCLVICIVCCLATSIGTLRNFFYFAILFLPSSSIFSSDLKSFCQIILIFRQFQCGIFNNFHPVHVYIYIYTTLLPPVLSGCRQFLKRVRIYYRLGYCLSYQWNRKSWVATLKSIANMTPLFCLAVTYNFCLVHILWLATFDIDKYHLYILFRILKFFDYFFLVNVNGDNELTNPFTIQLKLNKIQRTNGTYKYK